MPAPEEWSKVRKAAHECSHALTKHDLTVGEALSAAALLFGALITIAFNDRGVPKPVDLARAIVANALDMVVSVDRVLGKQEGR